MIRPRFFRLALVALIPVALISAGALAQSPAPAVTAPATPAPETPAPTVPATPAPAAPAPATPPPAAEAPATPPPAVAPVQTADPFGEEITLTPKTAVILKGSAAWDSAFETLTDSFRKLAALLDKQGIKPSGNSMIVYTSTDDSGFTFQAEIPVDQEPKNPGKDISMGKTPEGKALKFVHRGSYDNMDNTYEAITNHLDDKKLEAKDTFIEEYITDPLKTAEDKLVINVYVPLK
jgi:effector-binding domain-containing protein